MTTAPQNPALPDLTSRYIGSKEDLTNFRCGERAIDQWAKSNAYRLHEKGRTRVTVFQPRTGGGVCGFYAMSLTNEDSSKLQDANDRDAWRDGAPFTYLQWVAVHRPRQRQGIGRVMLVAALRQALATYRLVPIYGVSLRSLNADTTRLYESFGFHIARYEDGNAPLMILPIWNILDLFGVSHSIRR